MLLFEYISLNGSGNRGRPQAMPSLIVSWTGGTSLASSQMGWRELKRRLAATDHVVAKAPQTYTRAQRAGDGRRGRQTRTPLETNQAEILDTLVIFLTACLVREFVTAWGLWV